MIFSRDDLRVESIGELLEFLPSLIFVALVAPFVIVAYKLGFLLDVLGILDE